MMKHDYDTTPVIGVKFKVKWPSGYFEECVGSDSVVSKASADPNDHYRPKLTSLVGKQGIHWQWGLTDGDVADNTLTITIRQDKAMYVTILALQWS